MMAMPFAKNHFSDSTVDEDREQLAVNVAKMVSAIEGAEEQDMSTQELGTRTLFGSPSQNGSRKVE